MGENHGLVCNEACDTRVASRGAREWARRIHVETRTILGNSARKLAERATLAAASTRRVKSGGARRFAASRSRLSLKVV